MSTTIGASSIRRPEIFISACSADLRSVRDEVKRAVDAIGCHGIYQENFAPEHGTVAEMLRRQIEACDAVIHIAGICYGAEPRAVPPGASRISYTQMEYHLARELKKKLYVFVASDTFPYDPFDPEPEDKQSLQTQHRQLLLTGTHLREEVDSRERLAIRVRELRESLEQIQRQTAEVRTRLRQLAVTVTILCLMGVGFGVWMYQRPIPQDKQIPELVNKVDQLTQSVALIEVVLHELRTDSQFETAAPELTGTERMQRALERLALKRGIKKDTLADDVSQSATRILEAPGAGLYERSLASYAQQQFDDAAKFADEAVARSQAESFGPHNDEVVIQKALAQHRAMLLAGDAYGEMGNFGLAEERYQTACKLVPKAIDKRAWDAATEKLGSSVWRRNDYAAAEQLYRELLRFREAEYGPDDPRTMACYNALGISLHNLHKNSEAEPMLRKYVAFSEMHFGGEAPETGVAITNFGHVLIGTNRYSAAEPLFARALKIDEDHYGRQHVRVAASLNNLGGIALEMGHLQDAMKYFEESLTIYEGMLHGQHPALLEVLNNLAGCYRQFDRIEDAERLYRRALEISQKTFDPDSPKSALALGNLGRLLANTNRVTEGEAYVRKALAINEATYGPNDLRVAPDLSDLGSILLDKGDLGGADQLYERALKIYEADQPVSEHVGIMLNNRALVKMSQGDFVAAEPLLRRVISINEAIHDANFPQLAQVLSNLASVRDELEDPAEAEALLRRALQISQLHLGPTSSQVADQLLKLGGLLRRAKEYAAAEVALRRAVSIYETKLATDHPHVARALSGLLVVLFDTNRAKQGITLGDRALSIASEAQRRGGYPLDFQEALEHNIRNSLRLTGMAPDQIEARMKEARALPPSTNPITPYIDRTLGPLPTR